MGVLCAGTNFMHIHCVFTSYIIFAYVYIYIYIHTHMFIQCVYIYIYSEHVSHLPNSLRYGFHLELGTIPETYPQNKAQCLQLKSGMACGDFLVHHAGHCWTPWSEAEPDVFKMCAPCFWSQSNMYIQMTFMCTFIRYLLYVLHLWLCLRVQFSSSEKVISVDCVRCFWA